MQGHRATGRVWCACPGSHASERRSLRIGRKSFDVDASRLADALLEAVDDIRRLDLDLFSIWMLEGEGGIVCSPGIFRRKRGVGWPLTRARLLDPDLADLTLASLLLWVKDGSAVIIMD